MGEKNSIKIPKNITLIYSSKKKIITIIGLIQTKSFKLDIKPIIYKNKIEITDIAFKKLANNQKKNIKALQYTTIALIKQIITETSFVLYKKLIFVGIGYRGFDVENFTGKLIMLKLGYSHFLYFKIPIEVKTYCLKFTKLFIYSNSYQNVTQTASDIRSLKKPEPYKGKGILHSTEKIILKEGKKI